MITNKKEFQQCCHIAQLSAFEFNIETSLAVRALCCKRKERRDVTVGAHQLWHQAAILHVVVLAPVDLHVLDRLDHFSIQVTVLHGP